MKTPGWSLSHYLFWICVKYLQGNNLDTKKMSGLIYYLRNAWHFRAKSAFYLPSIQITYGRSIYYENPWHAAPAGGAVSCRCWKARGWHPLSDGVVVRMIDTGLGWLIVDAVHMNVVAAALSPGPVSHGEAVLMNRPPPAADDDLALVIVWRAAPRPLHVLIVSRCEKNTTDGDSAGSRLPTHVPLREMHSTHANDFSDNRFTTKRSKCSVRKVGRGILNGWG